MNRTLTYLLPIAIVLLVQPGFAQNVADQLKLAQPGSEHEKLAGYVGNWDLEIKMGGGRSAMTYRGTAQNRMIVDGRFLEVEYEAAGKADNQKGVFIAGFDARHQRFALVALDSFGTYFVTSQGKRRDDGKAKLLGTDDDPQMKAMGYTKEFAHVLDWRSADQFAIEVWFVDTRTAAKKEFKSMEYIFTRTK